LAELDRYEDLLADVASRSTVHAGDVDAFFADWE
jgi:hypothetical protein